MKLSGKIAIVMIFFGLLVTAYGLKNRGKHKLIPEFHNAPSPVVRLYNKSNEFVCTGTVVDLKHIVTAGHCTHLGQKLIAVSDDGLKRDVKTVGVSDPRMDQAVLKGNLSDLKFVPLETDPKMVITGMLAHRKFYCGYPMGGALLCAELGAMTPFKFGFAAQAILYPGMSGGPVIDMETGKLIGTNYAVMEEGPGARFQGTSEEWVSTDVGVNE